MEEYRYTDKNYISSRLLNLRKNLSKLDDEDLKSIISLGKLADLLMGYPIATLTSNSSGTSTSIDPAFDTGRMLLMGISPGMGEEFADSSASLGGMGLAALSGFDEISENLGSTALASMALGGFLGMALLPPPGMFGNYVYYRMALGKFTCSAYLNAKPLPCGDNLQSGNTFLSRGPVGSSPADNMAACLSGLGRTVLPGEISHCPGALLGFCGTYGFY